jgi:hypothetical protein
MAGAKHKKSKNAIFSYANITASPNYNVIIFERVGVCTLSAIA